MLRNIPEEWRSQFEGPLFKTIKSLGSLILSWYSCFLIIRMVLPLFASSLSFLFACLLFFSLLFVYFVWTCVKMFYVSSYQISHRVLFCDGEKINCYSRFKSQVTNPIFWFAMQIRYFKPNPRRYATQST